MTRSSSSSRPVDVNYLYFLHYVKQIPGWQSLKVLDFGCGAGEMVRLLRREGVDCYGADVFYGGASQNAVRDGKLFKEGVIRSIPESGELPFEKKSFDLVISNQVLEHVPDLRGVIDSLDAVLKDDGVMYHHFPSREVLREGHVGIPLVHRLPKGELRFSYALLMRSIGFGYFKGNLTPKQWVARQLDWLDRYCFYRRYGEVRGALEQGHAVCHREIDYCRFRARGRRTLRLLLGAGFMKGLYERLFRRLAFMAVELSRR